MDRTDLVDQANEVGRVSRRAGAPPLDANSSRQTLLAWLQWCDANGCWLDELSTLEGFEPLSAEEAWEEIAEMLRDS
jgi:hypothetical protein